MAAGYTPGSKEALNYLRQLLVQRHVDPDAAQAVFSVEGASGGIGDGGHAFGPGQFNNAGGVWTGKYAGESPQQLNQRAWSAPGLTELADRVSKVAGGLKGGAAINAIVRKFERPANPNGEVAKALGRLGLPYTGGGDAGSAGTITGPMGVPGGQQAILANLVAQQNAFLSGGTYSGPSVAQTMAQFNLGQQADGGQPFFQEAPAAANSTPYSGKVKFLGNTQGEDAKFLNVLGQAVSSAGGSQVKITSGYRDPQHNAAVGGVSGSKHLTGDAMDGYALIGGKWVPLGTALLPVAKKYGLRSGDVAGFFNGGRDPVHVDYGAGG